MLTAVVIFNVLLSLVCFYIAWKVWQLKQVLEQMERTLIVMERCTHNVLSQAPNFLLQRQNGTSQLRQHYQRLEVQIQQVQQLVGVLNLGRVAWRQFYRLK